LIRRKFLNVEDDIFEDFDQRMIRAVMYDPWQDFSQYDGLTGYGRYWITRLCYEAPSVQTRECLFSIIKLIEERLQDISIEEQTDVYCFLHDLQQIQSFENENVTRLLKRVTFDSSFPRLGDSTVGNIIRRYQHNRYSNDALLGEIDIALKQISDFDIEKAPTSTGLLDGYAGEGMIRLMVLNPINRSWMNLL